MRNSAYVLLLVLPLAGCQSGGGMPLVFGQTQTIGIAIGGGVTEQGAEFTLGYRDRNVAVIPVSVQQANGDWTQINGETTDDADALSVLGQFEASTQNRADVTLGKFFATGVAARRLADGFACELGACDEPQDTAPRTPESGSARADEPNETEEPVGDEVAVVVNDP